MTQPEFEQMFPLGEPNDAYAQYFTGRSFVAPLTDEGVPIMNVTFEPCCRNVWHIHHASSGGGQILICTGGSGWHQVEGQEPESMTPGTICQVPAGKRHWHGAKAGSWFSHLAIAVPGEDTSVEWLEPVDPEDYDRLPKE